MAQYSVNEMGDKLEPSTSGGQPCGPASTEDRASPDHLHNTTTNETFSIFDQPPPSYSKMSSANNSTADKATNPTALAPTADAPVTNPTSLAPTADAPANAVTEAALITNMPGLTPDMAYGSIVRTLSHGNGNSVNMPSTDHSYCHCDMDPCTLHASDCGCVWKAIKLIAALVVFMYILHMLPKIIEAGRTNAPN